MLPDRSQPVTESLLLLFPKSTAVRSQSPWTSNKIQKPYSPTASMHHGWMLDAKAGGAADAYVRDTPSSSISRFAARDRFDSADQTIWNILLLKESSIMSRSIASGIM